MIVNETEGGNLTPGVIKRLRQIFHKLGWKINPDDFDEDESIFDKYCLMLSHLDDEEKDLILTLTEEFFLCSSIEYRGMIKTALGLIPLDTIKSCKEVYLVPLIATKDFGKVKSSTSWLYNCITEILPKLPQFDGKKRNGFTDPRILNTYAHRKNALILFCDDFIGTGDTAIDALNFYNKNLRKIDDIPFVVTLVVQEQGAEAVMDFGFDVAFTEIRSRGISDSAKLNVSKALEIMERIESKLKIKPEFNFGYKKSEALVSMMRTPNNTFPVFWVSKMATGMRWASPFERI